MVQYYHVYIYFFFVAFIMFMVNMYYECVYVTFVFWDFIKKINEYMIVGVMFFFFIKIYKILTFFEEG